MTAGHLPINNSYFSVRYTTWWILDTYQFFFSWLVHVTIDRKKYKVLVRIQQRLTLGTHLEWWLSRLQTVIEIHLNEIVYAYMYIICI